MDTPKMEQTKEETLADYLDFFKGKLVGDDITHMSITLGISVSSLYNYLGGKISNKFTGKAIMEEGIRILSERNIFKQD